MQQFKKQQQQQNTDTHTHTGEEDSGDEEGEGKTILELNNIIYLPDQIVMNKISSSFHKSS